jgi:peroxiredoxin family protein|tara:strand:+ start:2599 stop:4572 length:1974 start_codon:yes stop_codon:yes gene_type:complete
MNNENEMYTKISLKDWISDKCMMWRDHYQSNYQETHDEYYRIWRGIWDKSDSMRDSERSKLISPATQQAVESAVAEIEEATFGRGKFFDIKDDFQDNNPADVAIIRNQLEEDMNFSKARSSIAECLLNSAIFGTGIGELILDEVTELKTASQPQPEMGLTAVGVEKRERVLVKIDPIMPQNFLIDPLATNVDDALGVAIEKMVPMHSIQQGIDSGIYRDVEIESVASDSNLEDASKITMSDTQDMVKLTKYYGLVPTDLLEDEDMLEDDESEVVDFPTMVDDEEGVKTSYTEAIVVIANDDTVLKVERNPYMKKDRPIIAFSWDTVPFKFWGRGICEKAYNSQKALDTEMRARIDALALTVHPMMGIDASRMPRGAKLEVRPGKTILTNGNPREILNPMSFGQLDQVTFAQAQQLQTMVQQSTGAIDSAGIPGSINGEATAAGISMGLGAIIKRHKRTLINFQENFLIPFVEKAACRYMQFEPELYPAKDYKFVASSSLGIIAREYEVTQLVQLLQTMSPDSPMYPMLVESIVDNMGLANREAIIQQLQNVNKPNPEEQQMQQMQQQMAMEQAKSSIENLKAQTAEIVSRIQQNNVETQLLPIEEETKRIAALAKSVGLDEFERLVKYAELELKEKELDVKEKISESQVKMASDNNS